ncbi:MAG: hypothetical protein RL754_1317 [Bacteroidota bacterium]
MGSRRANLFLIGAAKSGTTTLARLLSEHPQIEALAIKEPGHFCTDLRTSTFTKSYNRLLQWDEAAYFAQDPLPERHIGFVEEAANYQRLVDACDAPFILDASTAYLYSTEAAINLRAYNPQAKIVVILRAPQERAYSHYMMARKYGMEKLPVTAAFERELKLSVAKWGRDECYLELGNYASQLERYYKTFAKEQILVLFAEELDEDPQKVLTRVAHFLDLPTFAAASVRRENAGSVPRYPKLNAFGMRVLAPVRDKLPSETVRTLKKLTQRKPEPLPEEAKALLRGYYEGELVRLEKMINKDLQHWK